MNKQIETPKRKMEVLRAIQIKGYEIDVMGIVSNINYIKYFEDIRTDFLEKYYPFAEMMAIGISPILMHTEIDYKIPLTIYDKPTGICWVTKLEKMRWEFTFEIINDGKIHATGIQRGAFFDLNQKRPTFIPQNLLDMWNNE
jgi:acyl-CoA thioester hydrolase